MAPLTLAGLEKKIANERRGGALIYIKKVDKSGAPLNFQRSGNTAISGNWTTRLKARDFNWMMVYQRLTPDEGRVWIGDLDKVISVGNGRYAFHLSTVRGPLNVPKSLRNLVGNTGTAASCLPLPQH